MGQKSLHIYKSDECEKLLKISGFDVYLFSVIHTVGFFRGTQIYEKKHIVNQKSIYIHLSG